MTCRRQGGLDLATNHVSLDEAQELQQRVKELEEKVCVYSDVHFRCVHGWRICRDI